MGSVIFIPNILIAGIGSAFAYLAGAIKSAITNPHIRPNDAEQIVFQKLQKF